MTRDARARGVDHDGDHGLATGVVIEVGRDQKVDHRKEEGADRRAIVTEPGLGPELDLVKCPP